MSSSSSPPVLLVAVSMVLAVLVSLFLVASSPNYRVVARDPRIIEGVATCPCCMYPNPRAGGIL